MTINGSEAPLCPTQMRAQPVSQSAGLPWYNTLTDAEAYPKLNLHLLLLKGLPTAGHDGGWPGQCSLWHPMACMRAFVTAFSGHSL